MSPIDEIAIASAPMRVSLAGGGTDLPSYAERFGGTVLSLAIDRQVAVGAFRGTADERVFELLGPGIRIDHDELMSGNLATAAISRVTTTGYSRLACVTAARPGSGLGGSGAFLVALLHALRAKRPPKPVKLAEEASAIEMVDLRRPVGKQDHYLAALGGLQVLSISKSGAVVSQEIEIGAGFARYTQERLLLFHTGLERDAGAILTTQDRQTHRSDHSTLQRLHAIRSLVPSLLKAIEEDDFDAIGPILSEHWRHKSRLSRGVAPRRAEELYALALASGADGAKLLGAGGGGYLLVSCRDGRQSAVREAMTAAGAAELHFAVSSLGSHLRFETAPEAAIMAAQGGLP